MINLMQGDCLERMTEIPDGSVDMVLADPPYGTTACKWDTVIDLPLMWEQLKRVIKPNGAIVMTASQPFTSALVMSNVAMFRYCWVWKKEKGANIGVMKYQPAKVHEDVCVFSKNTHGYNPQMEIRPEENKRNNKPKMNNVGVQGRAPFLTEHSRGLTKYKYPTSVKEFNSVRNGRHPTQKPVALMDYLIRTYTNPGETVLDFTMGSGTTGVACVTTGRKFIGIELDQGYLDIARQRIEAVTPKEQPQ